MASLPTITLDTTLTELYQRTSTKSTSKRIGYILTGVSSAFQITPNIPRNAKYIYQDSPFNNLPQSELTEENAELQRSLAIKYLSLVPQRDAFISGNTAIIMFHLDESEQQIAHDKSEAEKSVAHLDPRQKPRFIFCSGPGSIPFEEAEVDALAYKIVLDGLDRYPLTVPLDKQWFVNTKAALANSGLPTPNADIIETVGHSPEASSCCVDCQASDGIFISSSCTGVRGQWLDEQADRIMAAISRCSLPLVVKNQQSVGGAGTFMINSEEDRERVKRDFSSGLLRKTLSQVTAENYHLKPGSVLLSDLVSKPIGNFGLTFFVTDTGDAIFLAVSEQMIDGNNSWVGSNINYRHQAALEKKFTPIMTQIALWLHENQYYGPAGADILETTNRSRNGELEAHNSEFHIVDLNARTSGSMCLSLLRSHFQGRGCNCASSFAITSKHSRESFIEHRRKEFESGRMCILSWYDDIDGGESIGDVVVGAEDEEKLQ
ncbi:MAG: hypothetical protein M1821_009179 [Bathelium mastoideum]|nr:MAG: hypothetical protein M1821_009179 [Bathelium mastoideum]